MADIDSWWLCYGSVAWLIDWPKWLTDGGETWLLSFHYLTCLAKWHLSQNPAIKQSWQLWLIIAHRQNIYKWWRLTMSSQLFRLLAPPQPHCKTIPSQVYHLMVNFAQMQRIQRIENQFISRILKCWYCYIVNQYSDITAIVMVMLEAKELILGDMRYHTSNTNDCILQRHIL